MKVKQVVNSSTRLLGFSVVLLFPINGLAQNSNVLAKADTSTSNSLFVVSDDELKTYSNTADLIRELKVLKKDKQSLLDYSKKLREKFKDLEDYYSKQGIVQGGEVISRNFAPDILAEKQAELEIVKNEKDKLSQDIQNLKTEYEALKLQNGTIKAEYSNYKEETEQKIKNLEDSKISISSETEILKQKVGELTNELLNKEKNSASCFEQLDQSQKLVTQIPEFERKIVELKNEILMKKSAAELFGFDTNANSKHGNVENTGIASAGKKSTTALKRPTTVKEAVIVPAVVTPVMPEVAPSLNSDMMIIEVTGDKVALRAGPGLNNSTIMDIGRGAKLTVEAKDKDWYRVNSPTGGRAYIHKDYVKIIDNGKRQNVRPKSFEKKDDFVSMEVEPIKPPLPAKPIKRIGVDQEANAKSLDSLSMTQESIALQALKKAMNINSQKFENSTE